MEEMGKGETLLAERAKALLEERKAEDLLLISVAGVSPYADWILIGTAPNERALGAYAEALQEYCEAEMNITPRIEGKGTSGWVLVDCGDLICHLFLKGKREEVALEELLGKSVRQD